MTEELKPCPFCGGGAEMDHHQLFRHYRTGEPLDQIAVYCRECSAQIAHHHGDLSISREETAEIVVAAWNTRPAPDMAAVVEARPQDHWTAKGAIASARALIEAGNKLCLMAETSGGTAGRDDGLVDAINHWAAERDKHKQVLRIIELEGHEPEIGAGYESLPAALQSLRGQP